MPTYFIVCFSGCYLLPYQIDLWCVRNIIIWWKLHRNSAFAIRSSFSCPFCVAGRSWLFPENFSEWRCGLKSWKRVCKWQAITWCCWKKRLLLGECSHFFLFSFFFWSWSGAPHFYISMFCVWERRPCRRHMQFVLGKIVSLLILIIV